MGIYGRLDRNRLHKNTWRDSLSHRVKQKMTHEKPTCTTHITCSSEKRPHENELYYTHRVQQAVKKCCMKGQLSRRASCCRELVLATPSPSPSLTLPPPRLPLPLPPAPPPTTRSVASSKERRVVMYKRALSSLLHCSRAGATSAAVCTPSIHTCIIQ